jgi:hypothetical protein
MRWRTEIASIWSVKSTINVPIPQPSPNASAKKAPSDFGVRPGRAGAGTAAGGLSCTCEDIIALPPMQASRVG